MPPVSANIKNGSSIEKVLKDMQAVGHGPSQEHYSILTRALLVTR
jgi:hypothetical protein